MKFLGISRSFVFSPNMTGADAAIIEAVANELRSRGHEVDTMGEDDFVATFALRPQDVQAEQIFGMYRQPATLQLLERLSDEFAIPAVNSALGVRQADRLSFSRLFMQNDIPMPHTTIVEGDDVSALRYPCWLKRGEGCAQERGDVCYVADEYEAAEALAGFRGRGIDGPLVASNHHAGDLIKFYGVAGTTFFFWYYASQGHSKFGLESINGKEQGYTFSEAELAAITNRAASVLQLDVYGGDAVVSPEGLIHLIDFNDWPSFSPCRREAARAIADLLENKN